jgi:hypothetical protein
MFRLGHAGRIIVEGESRSDVFKVCVWISNNNPLSAPELARELKRDPAHVGLLISLY